MAGVRCCDYGGRGRHGACVHTNTVDDHLHVLSDSGAKGIIVSTNALADRVCAAASQCPDVSFVISIEALGEGLFRSKR